MSHKNFLERIELEESAPSFAGYMNIHELMDLYYGRIGVYVSFSNDEKLELSGFDGSTLARPYGVSSYTVDTVVGRKVFTHKFYSHVFREKGSGGSKKFINDIRHYTKINLEEDIEVLHLLPYLKSEEIDNAVELIKSKSVIRYPFEQLWEITKEIAKPSSSVADKLWRRILLDLGYSGFGDPSGLGIIAKGRQVVTLFLDEKNLEVYDIMPIQRYRKDKRQRVNDAINNHNKRMHARRNRVAKKRTAPFRKENKNGLLSILTAGWL